MFAKKEFSVNIQRKRRIQQKNINEFVQAPDSIINFYLHHPVYILILLLQDDEYRKKDKKKKKDKDRERERGGVEAESPYLSKLVIKQGEGGGHTTTTTTPASSPPHNQRPLPKLKIKLGGTPAVQ